MNLQRISSQSEKTLEEFYLEFAAEYGEIGVNPCYRMLEFIQALKELPHADIWVFTSLISLVLATRDDYTSAIVRINFVSGEYCIEYPTSTEEPRFIGETKVLSCHGDPIDASLATIKIYDQLIGF